MSKLGTVSIRTRLYFGTVFSLVLLTAIGLLGYWALDNTRVTLKSLLEDKVQAIADTGQLRTTLGDLQRFEKEVIISFNNTNEVAELRKSWQQSLGELRTELGKVKDTHGDSADVAQTVDKVLAYLKQYEEGIAPVLEQVERAQIDGGAAGAYAGRVKEFTQGADRELAALSARSREDLQATQAALDERTSTLLAVIAASVVIALVVLIPLTTLSVRAISRSLTQARDLAERIAHGDLSNDVVVTHRDEIGQLVEAMGRMQDSLKTMVSQVRAATDSISTASTEIATGNQDLSARTEQTASNLQQTASSMEQLTGTVKQSADSARQANQLASSASSVAARGGQVVSQVVTTMDEINAASKKISDIIGVIDGIAFQTNILALNAAVEAARAGEQGRGFAVVAGEVRNLAQRSAQAAKEIKTLIGASVEKVESGSKLVQDAGTTMSEIVASVQRVADIIGEITAAAAEQSSGIGQVNTAVNQLDQMTQQNAALVEESAAAAESLKEQAHRLAGVVSAFKLAQDGHAAASGSRSSPAATTSPAHASIVAQAVIARAKESAPAAAPRSAPAAATRPAAAVAPAAPVAATKPTPPSDDDWETF